MNRYQLAIAVVVLVTVSACGSGQLQLPADAAGTDLFQQGQQFVTEEEWSNAARAFDTLLRNYPTSPFLPDARLGLGRAYYEQDRSDTLLLAIDAFKNFLTYHPSHEQVDYSQLMVAMSYMQLMRAPDRDQFYTREALDEFEAFMEDYPESSYRQFGVENMRLVVDTLAAHELGIAKFQIGRKQFEASRLRSEYALRKYPTTTHRCELLYTLAEALRRQGDVARAKGYYEQLVSEHADCKRVRDAQKILSRG